MLTSTSRDWLTGSGRPLYAWGPRWRGCMTPLRSTLSKSCSTIGANGARRIIVTTFRAKHLFSPLKFKRLFSSSTSRFPSVSLTTAQAAWILRSSTLGNCQSCKLFCLDSIRALFYTEVHSTILVTSPLVISVPPGSNVSYQSDDLNQSTEKRERNPHSGNSFRPGRTTLEP